MPRFYFDIDDHEGQFRDEQGMDLPDLEAAEAVARKTLSGLLQDALRHESQKDIVIVIRDGQIGPVLMRVTLETKPLQDDA